MKVLVRLVFAGAAIAVAFVIGMRTKYPPIQKIVRQMNKEAVNPETMKTAGKPGAYASVIRHSGRRSGDSYETPVQAMPMGDGFVIPLPYGTSPDWLKNVMAAGSADLVNEGETYHVDHPELVPADIANPLFPEKDQMAHRLLAVDDFLQVHTAEKSNV